MISVETILFCVMILVVAYAVVRWMFQKDTEVENRRRAAAKLAARLQAYGLTKTPEFLIDYSVGDYSGMAEKIKNLVELFVSGEDAVAREFDTVFEKCLAAKLLTETGRAYIAAKLTDAAKDTDPSVVNDAPVAGVV